MAALLPESKQAVKRKTTRSDISKSFFINTPSFLTHNTVIPKFSIRSFQRVVNNYSVPTKKLSILPHADGEICMYRIYYWFFYDIIYSYQSIAIMLCYKFIKERAKWQSVKGYHFVLYVKLLQREMSILADICERTRVIILFAYRGKRRVNRMPQIIQC